MGFYELTNMENCFRNPVWKKFNQDIYLLKDREKSWVIQQNFTGCGVQAYSQIYFGTSPSKCLPTKSKTLSLTNFYIVFPISSQSSQNLFLLR